MFLEAIILALVVIAIRKYNWENLKNFTFEKLYLPIIGIFLYILCNYFTAHDKGIITFFIVKYYTYFHILSLGFIIAGLCCNGKIKSMYIVAFGFFCNLMPIFANGKMPVSSQALLKASSPRIQEIILSGNSLSHGIFTHPKLYFLSDIIPIPKPYYAPKVISLGDILISIGLFFVLLEIARRRRNGTHF